MKVITTGITTGITAAAALALVATPALAAPTSPTPAAPSATSAASGATCSGSEVTSKLKSAWALSDRTRSTAEAIRHNTLSCRKAGLVWRSTRDKTALSFGDLTPSQAWAIPDTTDHRYGWTAVALGTQWGTQKNGRATYRVWPRVATTRWASSDKAWDEAIDAGLVTRAQAKWMRANGGYMGWRVGISEGGKFVFDIAGD